MFSYLFGCALAVLKLPVTLLLNYFDPPVLVLLYHRVASLSSDPLMLSVTPDHFRAQLRYLKEHFPLLRFEDDWSQVKKPSVVITFDDGYADNLTEALPILEELEIPATFFISTGTLGKMKEFWTDELGRILLAERQYPEQFVLDKDEQARLWKTASVGNREKLYRYLLCRLQKALPAVRELVLTELRCWAGEAETGREEFRLMTPTEVEKLAASRMSTIGAHTVLHSRLSSLDKDSQREEILESKRQLEMISGSEVKVFAYPYGTRSDYDDTSMAICRDAGFVKVASNFKGVAHRRTDPLQIPRHTVRNWPVSTFAGKLSRFWIL